MSAPRAYEPVERLRAAWERSRTGIECARLLHRSVEPTRRMIREAGLAWPAPHWVHPARVKDLPEPAPLDEFSDSAQRLATDMAADRSRQQVENYKALYDEARTQLRTQEEVCAVLAEQCIEPRPALKLTAPKKRADGKPHRAVILQISDWQMGQLVRAADTGGINEYGWEIMLERLQRWVDAAVASIRIQCAGFAIESGVLLFCGDMVEGHDVFNGQAWQLDKDAALQALDGADAWAAALEALIGALPGISWSAYCVPGNHGKPGGRSGGATPATFNFDFLFYEMVRRATENFPWREFVIEPCGRLLFRLADTVFATTHGNEVRGWGGIPFYGLDKTQGRLMQEMETVFTYWLLGHHHQNATIPSGRGARIINGNAVGPNQLSTAAVLGSTAATQNLLYVSRDFGAVMEHAYLFLAPGMRPKPTIYGEAT
jgi:hypothetical protein